MNKVFILFVSICLFQNIFSKIKLDFTIHAKDIEITDNVCFEQDGIILFENQHASAQFDCVTLPDETLSLQSKIYTINSDGSEKILLNPHLVLVIGNEASVSVTNPDETADIHFTCTATKF